MSGKRIIIRTSEKDQKVDPAWSENDYIFWFEKVDSEFWFELCQDKQFTLANERQLLYRIGRMALEKRIPSDKQLRWAKNILDSHTRRKEQFTASAHVVRGKHPMSSCEIRHVTARMAWHNDGWNGRICENPERNDYCVGEYSLLSRRIREMRKLNIEKPQHGELIDDPELKGYIPPCYWSINALGEKGFQIEHEHPLLKNRYIQGTPNISETLPPFSIFTWPFKSAFVRDEYQKKVDGKYPKNLEFKVDRFFNKLENNSSLVFLYCNYDNPVSADDRKYLLLGCSLLKDKGPKTYFQIPEKNLKSMRAQDGYQNFPTINWAIRLSLDEQYTFFLPYHEYLAEAEKTNVFDLLNEIKVIIDEPELIQSFKYVAMDIDDDQAIFLLTKLRKSYLIIREHGRIASNIVEQSLKLIDDFLERTWKKRGLFPGFSKIVRLLLGRENDSKALKLDDAILFLQEEKGDNYCDGLVKFLENPESNAILNKQIGDEIFELKEALEVKRLSADHLLALCTLNLTSYQFRRILENKIGKYKRSVSDICNNPYLLFEEYEFDSEMDDDNPTTGDRLEGPIDLGKIDIALFPDTRFLKRFSRIQNMRVSDPQRVRAITISYLRSLENSGHCFDIGINIEKSLLEYPLFYKTEYLLPESILTQPDEKMGKHLAGKLVLIEKNSQILYYLKEIKDAEDYISALFKSLLNMPDITSYSLDYKKTIKELRARLGDKFDEEGFKQERKKLYKNVFKKRLFILSGSPGTGKSFELLQIVDKLRNSKEKYLLLTPTGKAALRLSLNEEGIKNIEAQTIDKFIYGKDETADQSLPVQNLIIDEMSMVDLNKLHNLLRKVDFNSPLFRRLILVGDQHQLPPIGFGKVFVDAIRFITESDKYESNFISLETNCRQKLDSQIIEFAKIFGGHLKHYEPLIERAKNGGELSEGLKILFWGSREELQSHVKTRFLELFGGGSKPKDLGLILNRVLNLDDSGYRKVGELDSDLKDLRLDNFQIITPYRSGYYGSLGLNNYVQGEFRNREPFIGRREFPFRHSDKIIQTQNLYKNRALLLSNGSLGLVVNQYKENFYFPECGKPLSKWNLRADELELAYAITVHKAQGSGFEHVFFVLPSKTGLLFRELVYTALTRSKQGITVFMYRSTDPSGRQIDLENIRNLSSVALRKTSLLDNPFWDYTLSPAPGVNVRSRIEYIIYKKLQECKETLGGFDFRYEEKYELPKRNFDIKPDFTIILPSDKKVYWEHLGRLGVRSYEKNWDERLKIYEEENLIDSLVTTEERRGIDDKKIAEIILAILTESIESDVAHSNFSRHHYLLNSIPL